MMPSRPLEDKDLQALEALVNSPRSTQHEVGAVPLQAGHMHDTVRDVYTYTPHSRGGVDHNARFLEGSGPGGRDSLTWPGQSDRDVRATVPGTSWPPFQQSGGFETPPGGSQIGRHANY